MSSTSSPTVACDVRSRRVETRVAWLALTLSLGLPLVVGSMIDLPAALSMGASAVMALLIGVGLAQAGWLGSDRRLAAISWLGDGRWLLTDQAGRTVEGRLRSDARAVRGAVWLSWQVASGSIPSSRSILLAQGDVPDADLRRLSARLRLHGRRDAGVVSGT
jgi:hypothetical protein